MSITKYEAASLYDYVQQNHSSKKDYLVIDLDDSSCGYCVCNSKMDIRLDNSWQGDDENLWSVLTETLNVMVSNSHLTNIETEIEGQLISANKAFYNYFLSGKTLNDEAFSFLNIDISCAELDEKLTNLKEKISNLLLHAIDLVSADKMLDTNIIILGKAQEMYLVMYYIREELSFDPMLPDERFRNSELVDPYTDIVEKGMMLYETMTNLKHTYSLLAFNPESNSFDAIYTVSKENAKANVSELVFSEPLLLCEDDQLSIRVDDKTITISLPYSIAPARSDLIDVAIGFKDNEDTLFIRRCRFPTRIYNVKLS
ncbi:MAG: hypothetical protein SO040_11820 [Catenibacterium mitsuokai]|nr:hypothetical protein [Catenibacterium mitsuokai]MDY3677589.1 hypothetical protein [Catenibacterium mitsuokai]